MRHFSEVSSVMRPIRVVAFLGLSLLPLTSILAQTDEPPMLRASGELAAVETSILGPPSVRRVWNYTVSFMLPEGTPVTAGMPVLGFDTNELQTRLNDKQGELNTKRSELRRTEVNNSETLQDLTLRGEELKMEADKASRKAELPESVLARNAYHENQLLNQLAKHQRQANQIEQRQQALLLSTEEEILKAEVARLEAEVAEIRDGIGRMTVKAPRDGVVLHLTDGEGNKTSIGDQVWFGARVLEIPDLSQMVAKLEVLERDLARIRPGDTVQFRLDASPERLFTGTVDSISQVVRTRSSQQPAMVVDAVATINTPDMVLMRPGMRINAEIVPQQTLSSR